MMVLELRNYRSDEEYFMSRPVLLFDPVSFPNFAVGVLFVYRHFAESTMTRSNYIVIT